MKKTIQGFVSIFLALIILPVYTFALLTIDTSKISAAKNHLRISNDIVVDSILSNYNKDLYESYNILGIDKDQSYLEEYANVIAKSNIEDNYSNFYKSHLENLNLDVGDKDLLINTDNFKKQIIDYMSLKATYDFGNGVYNLVNMMSESKSYSKLLDKKYDYEKEYSKINLNLEKIGENFVSYKDKVEEINKIITKQAKDYTNLLEEIDSVDGEEEEKNEEILNIISKFKDDKNKELKELSDMNKVYTSIIKDLKKLDEAIYKSNLRLEDLNKELSKVKNKEIQNNIKAELNSANLDFNKENIDKLLGKLEENENNINKVISFIENNSEHLKSDGLINSYQQINTSDMDLKKLPLLGKYKIYNKLVNQAEKTKEDKEEKKEAKENRKKITSLAKKSKEVKNDSKKYAEDYINQNQKKLLDNFSLDIDSNLDNIENYNSYKNILKKTDTIIPEKVNTSKDNILISMYLVDKFSDKLSGNEFNSQLEYILFGHNSLSKNENIIQASIFSIRFLLNSLYAYTNADLTREATMVATAIGGWTSFGVPILRSLLLAGMSVGESFIDISTLNKAENLVAFKNKASWQVSLSNLDNIIANNLSKITSSALDNIYETIEDYSADSLDSIEDRVNEFTKQTIDGISQQIIAEFLNPIQNLLVNTLGMETTDIKKELINVLDNIEKNINGESELIINIKKEVFVYIKNKVLKEFQNIEENTILAYFNSLVKDIENKVKSKTRSVNEKLKTNINEAISNNKIKMKESIDKAISQYIGDLGGDYNNSSGNKSGLTFNYKDYLFALTLFRLSSSDQDSILKRALLVIDHEIKKASPNFNISNIIVSFELSSSIKINTNFLKEYIKIGQIEEKKRGAY
ncbi:DUF5702 domain-containing protein [Helcococcus massiliensis]|uniref:DUF5702 domain-containing protein n=1 Tax=Helcococcus massiliensis TaxID=2040290 RepID=UPI000CDEE9CE|nr:DUF5702 domain-containing protein [Helcococcus massiliensis]